MDGIIAYVLSKGYTDQKIAQLGAVFNYKGTVPTAADLPTTGNKVGDVYTAVDTGTEYVWVNTPTPAHWEALGTAIGTGKYATTITGDGTTTAFTITHNLNTKDTATLVYGSNNIETPVTIEHATVNTTVITFATAPAAGEVYNVACLVPQGPQGPKGETGDDGFSPVASVSKTGNKATISITDSTHTTTTDVYDGNNTVTVSNTGTSTNLVKYITIDGTESKMGMDISVSPTGTSTNDVRYITIDGTESRFTSVALRAMKSAWVTGTTAAAATAILNDDSVVAGDGFLATVYWSDLPGDLTQAEVKAFVMKKSGSYQKIIQFECTSGTVPPYAWFYNSYEGQWRSYVPLNDTVTSTSTNEALTANMGKNLQDQVNNLKNIGRFLAIWNCSTGLPLTDPVTEGTYTYRTGDYFRVGVVSSATPAVNYKPNGSSYTPGTASTTVETGDVEIGWVYYFDGSQWLAQSAGGGGLVQDVQVNGTSVLDSGSGIANIPNSSGSASGVMTSTQYTKLDGIEDGAEVNVLEGVQLNGTDLAIDANKKVNLTDALLADVKYTAQSLTDQQKSQARTNISAITLEEYDSTATPVDGVLYYVAE